MDFYKKIEKILIIFFVILFSFILVSCDNSNISFVQNCTVTFLYNDDNGTIETVPINYGDTISMPNTPKRNNYEFDGWYTDVNLNNVYDFSNKVINSFKLYAKWGVDYVNLTNTITTSIMKANVTITNKSYNTFLFIETTSITSTGSGIIFSKNSAGDYYFALTNNHVTVKKNGYSDQKLTVTDYLGNEYTATKYHESSEYDLGVVCFKKSIELKIIERESKNLGKDADIIALGQPKGQSNAITYGKITNYGKITLNDTPTYQSNVTFNVISHNAPTAPGSSGGAVLSLNLKLAGINYAGSENSNKEFLQGYSIPIEKINEYLTKYIYK